MSRFALFKSDTKTVEVFDSLVLPREILVQIKLHFKCTVFANDLRLQASGSDTCGWFAIYYCFHRWHNRGKTIDIFLIYVIEYFSQDLDLEDFYEEFFSHSTTQNEHQIAEFQKDFALG